ncbi:CHRD domain-containing protein [Noviherbaspirillum denitrificans]|uniref:CHRD domain-containing protein n=1 Tax=Noviherbaspirillum denitrificans TaxID=1968433 RepID=A0A254TC70_9BURK|nr:CHRD domain-containing protein [Noviherbaspirillum denitrificans]OWW20249.1 hypothetical protein AYR66_12845 [Noviherbaspirillum denitrificans]
MKNLPLACFVLLTGLTLAACGGGGGNSGATTGASLTPASTQAAVTELIDAFAATLTGAQEVPQRASSASGSGTVVIQASTRQMTATLTTTGIAATDARIQQAPAGLNGPVIFPLVETVRGSGIWTARAILTDAQVTAFRAGDFYFNVLSTNFGNGEIRGQILSQQPGTTPVSTGGSARTGTTATGTGLNPFVTSTAAFLTALRGTQEVPPTTSAAIGSGTVLVNPATRQLSAAVTTTGITGTAAHIHEGAPGISGPIIIGLAESTTGSGIWTTNAVLTEAQFNAMQAGNLYFNVHSTAFPNGEIRGQILPQTISLEFITGAAGRNVTTITPLDTGTTSTGTGATGTGAGTTGAGVGTSGTGIGNTGTGIGTTGTGVGNTGTGIGTTGTGIGNTGTGIGATGTGMTTGVGLVF